MLQFLTFKFLSLLHCSRQRSYIKYRLLSVQGIQNLSQAEAQRVSGIDPDFSKREMWQHIHEGGTAEWIVQLQMLSDADIASFSVNPFDCSKPWPEDKFPWHEIGRIVLDKNVRNEQKQASAAAQSWVAGRAQAHSSCIMRSCIIPAA